MNENRLQSERLFKVENVTWTNMTESRPNIPVIAINLLPILTEKQNWITNQNPILYIWKLKQSNLKGKIDRQHYNNKSQ